MIESQYFHQEEREIGEKRRKTVKFEEWGCMSEDEGDMGGESQMEEESQDEGGAELADDLKPIEEEGDQSRRDSSD